MGLENIKKLCNELMEKNQTVKIHGYDYDIEEVIEFALKFDPKVITLRDAINTIQKMNLFQELKRMVRDKDRRLDYYNSRGVF